MYMSILDGWTAATVLFAQVRTGFFYAYRTYVYYELSQGDHKGTWVTPVLSPDN